MKSNVSYVIIYLAGFGIYKYPNCSIQYVGKFENGKRHGPGRFQDKSSESNL